MPSVEGYGGYKNKVGTIVGPDLHTGRRPCSALLDRGRRSARRARGIKVIATDGYASTFTHDQVENAALPHVRPDDRRPHHDHHRSLQMIVAYAHGRQPLDPGIAPLRVALVSPAAEQVTDSSNGPRWSRASRSRHSRSSNGDTVEMYTMSELEALTCGPGLRGHKNKTGTIAGPDLYKGVSVLGLLDDTGGLPEGAGVKVIASDGYAATFTHDEVTNPVFPMYDPMTGDPDHRRSPAPCR